MLKIRIRNLTRNSGLSNRLLNKIAKRTLATQHIGEGDVTIVFTSDSVIKRLNRAYLGRRRPTDVLSFCMDKGRRLPGGEQCIGEVIISVDRARIQARRFATTVKKEVALYVIHGLLHLAGHRDGSKKLERLQERILAEFFK